MNGTTSGQPPFFAGPGYRFGDDGSGCLTLPAGAEPSVRDGIGLAVGLHLFLDCPDAAEEVGERAKHLGELEAVVVSALSKADGDAVASIRSGIDVRNTVLLNVVAESETPLGALARAFDCGLSSCEVVVQLCALAPPKELELRDWSRQVAHGLLASRHYWGRLLGLFHDDQRLGLVFPEYHAALRGKLGFGPIEECDADLAARLGVNLVGDHLRPYPVGGGFVARAAALQAVLRASAQEPGLERLLGEAVVDAGYSCLQVRPDRPHNLSTFYSRRWPYDRFNPASYQEALECRRLVQSCTRPRVVVYSAVAGGYDRPLPQNPIASNADFVMFSDRPVDDCGLWDVRSMDYWHPDPVRMARYVKTHPHKYFPDYDVAIWIDANVIVEGDLDEVIGLTLDHPNAVLGGITHPERSCIYREAEVLLDLGKDEPERIHRLVRAATAIGFPKNWGLIETNLVIFNLRRQGVCALLAAWWRWIDHHSRRDQLALMPALWESRSHWQPVFEIKRSLRDTKGFAYLGHGQDCGFPFKALSGLGSTAAPRSVYGEDSSARATAGKIDIVVCVHNALEDVRRCLPAAYGCLGPEDRLIVFDDGSEAETASYIHDFASSRASVVVMRREPPAAGYTHSANEALRTCRGDAVLLLNSDAILTKGAFDALVRALSDNPTVGMAGPLSNAASTQSIPEIGGGETGQTAINPLPPGIDLIQMNAWCARQSIGRQRPSTPLLHGFCMLIKRSALQRVGLFDEERFPNGYGEENDLCFRMTDAGFDLKVATDAFVFHRKSASFNDPQWRFQLMKRGGEALAAKHSPDRIARAVAVMEGHPELKRMRDAARQLYR